ncbi:monocarboxylate transporter 13-like isoform X2 [Patiria miniata]|uniref:Major facilitator superfamily (MFS) profile domain-containing protein n=1 Tax=Patiria miniata TaxID=46514 RepID=A0A913ZUQ6_PATMI|nr:monocarboxylate transporter 13-like isoform X2 [Patiria miniata]
MNNTFAQIGWSFVIVNYSSFMERNELSTEQISFVLTVFGAAEVAGKIAFAMFGDRLPCLKMYVIVTSSLCGAVVSAFLTLCSTFQQMMCLSIAWGLCRGGCYGASMAAANELFRSYGPRVVTAIALFGFGLGSLMGAPILGGLYDLTGDYTFSLFVLVGSFSLSVLCAVLIPAKRKLQRRWCVSRDAMENKRHHNKSSDTVYLEKPNTAELGTPNPAYESEC